MRNHLLINLAFRKWHKRKKRSTQKLFSEKLKNYKGLTFAIEGSNK